MIFRKNIDETLSSVVFTPNEYRAKLVGFGVDGASSVNRDTGKLSVSFWESVQLGMAYTLELAIKNTFKGTYMVDSSKLWHQLTNSITTHQS